MLVGRVYRKIALPAENGSVLLTEQERSPLLADVTEREFLRRRTEKGKPSVLGGELVGVVDAVVAASAERCLVGGAKHGRLVLIAHVTLDLHLVLLLLLIFFFSSFCPPSFPEFDSKRERERGVEIGEEEEEEEEGDEDGFGERRAISLWAPS